MYKKRLKKINNEPDFESKLMFCLFGDGWENMLGESGFSMDDMRPIKEFYNKNASVIYEKWRQQERPGERPKCWWWFEAVEPLKVIESGTYPKNIKMYYGDPIEANRVTEWEKTEDERDYLERLGLLEEWEIDELKHWDKVRGRKTIESGTEATNK